MYRVALLPALSALALSSAAEAGAQRPASGGPRITLPSHSSPFAWERGRGFRGRHGFGGLIVVERVVPVPVIVEAPPPPPVIVAPPSPPSPPRKPYVIGSSYASLPASCMKADRGRGELLLLRRGMVPAGGGREVGDLQGGGQALVRRFGATCLDSCDDSAHLRTNQEQMMRESVGHLTMLKRELASIAGGDRPSAGERTTTGHAALDAALGGGLMRGRVHELFSATGDDGPSAAGFAAMLALRTIGRQAPIFWLSTDEAERRGGSLHAPGLVELGGDPHSLVLGIAPDAKALLRAAADAARCPGLQALIVECWGRCPQLDLTASRRLALAAEHSGATLFLLRLEAEPVPSAADTRWQVQAAPSQALEADAPGGPTFEIELLRRRSGPAGMRWRLEWNRDRLLFTDPALSGTVVPLPSRRSAATHALRLSA